MKENSSPKLSVITVNYNDKDGLERTIKSTVAQTWTDYEIIIVDGGSTDGSREVINKYKELFAWWCSEPDDGVFAAMNKGVCHAQGDYCIFMNAGDVFFNGKVLKDIFQLHLDNYDIISGYVKSKQDNTLQQPHIKDILGVLFGYSLSHQASFIRRYLLLKYPYDEHLKISSDWKLFVEAILIDKCSWTYIDNVVAIQDMTGISNRPDSYEKIVEERLLSWYDMLPELCKVLDYSEKKRLLQYLTSRTIAKILKAAKENNADEFKMYVSKWKLIPSDKLKQSLGFMKYFLYVSHPSMGLLRLWLKLH